MYQIDPLTDLRWARLVERHPASSVFHTTEWLSALQRTYDYQPIVFTDSNPETELENAIVFCRVRSWLTGSRLVSLPFSDHCQPLVQRPEPFKQMLALLKADLQSNGLKYLELRPLSTENITPEVDALLYPNRDHFQFHVLDLQSDLDTLFRAFHKSCIQRKIRRAEREGLIYEEGRSPELLAKFYELLVLTRRRHRLPPQPLRWFQALMALLGDRLSIRLLSKDGRPVASILTLTHKRTLMYKYGCSDQRYHNLGGMPLLFWYTIQEATRAGFEKLDLGRSESDNTGLIQFKEHLGAVGTTLNYYRYPAPTQQTDPASWAARIAHYGFSRVPDAFLVPVGNLLYRHLG